jgi:hypothetical protein
VVSARGFDLLDSGDGPGCNDLDQMYVLKKPKPSKEIPKVKNKQKLLVWAVLLVAFVGVLWATPATPQQNISGGQAVTITQGGNVGVVTAAGAQKVDGSGVNQPVTGTFWQATQPVSGPLTDAQLRASAIPVSGSLSSAPLTACGATNYDSGPITIPNSTTVLTATTTCISAVMLINLTNTQQTCTITDGQGSPANLIPPSYDLLAKSFVRFPLDGARAVSGIKWSCTNAAAVTGIIRGNQ